MIGHQYWLCEKWCGTKVSIKWKSINVSLFFIEFAIHFIESIWNLHIEQFNKCEKEMIKMRFGMNVWLLSYFILVLDVFSIKMVKKLTLNVSSLNCFLLLNGINYGDFTCLLSETSTCWLLFESFPFDQTVMIIDDECYRFFESLFQPIIIPNSNRKQFQRKPLKTFLCIFISCWWTI